MFRIQFVFGSRYKIKKKRPETTEVQTKNKNDNNEYWWAQAAACLGGIDKNNFVFHIM